ncbi:hypothetical protein [Ruegeria arenilitoris]|uniref:hypothetical protein n=1 Tax=Ruegeria arenilitoris TaxID=1173585 RepID=UPI00147AC1DB|nr:hypothetical protein [Ruegeria arenilitoris]
MFHSQNMADVARAIADRKTSGQRKKIASDSKVKCCWNSRLALKRKKPVDGEAMRLQEKMISSSVLAETSFGSVDEQKLTGTGIV